MKNLDKVLIKMLRKNLELELDDVEMEYELDLKLEEIPIKGYVKMSIGKYRIKID